MSERDWRFSQKWRTDNTGFDLCYHFIFNLKNNGSPLFLCSYIEFAIYPFFLKKNQHNLKNNWKTFFATVFDQQFFFKFLVVHQLMRSPILISIKWLLLLVGSNIFTIVLLGVTIVTTLIIFISENGQKKFTITKFRFFSLFENIHQVAKFSPKNIFIWTLILVW
jgi:hypothetical protein